MWKRFSTKSETNMIINIILAYDRVGNIGKNGKLPWPHAKTDMKIFSEYTKGNGSTSAVLMGRKTWESLPYLHRPLSGRVNIVLSNTMGVMESAHVVNTFTGGVKLARDIGMSHLWIIGGSSLYNEAIESGLVEYVYATEMEFVVPDCDASVDVGQIYKKFELDKHIQDNYGEGVVPKYRIIKLTRRGCPP